LFKNGVAQIQSTIKSVKFLERSAEKFSSFIYNLARSVFSVPATSTGVERQFCEARLVIQERRTSLNPEQLRVRGEGGWMVKCRGLFHLHHPPSPSPTLKVNYKPKSGKICIHMFILSILSVGADE
jgi:hypothetical protein